MLRTMIAAALSFAAGAAMSPGAMAQATSFLLINGTAYPISQLQVSESDFNFWTANVLRPPPIKAGERRQVSFNAPVTYCQADLQVGFADGGSPAVWRNLNLCTLTKIKLSYDRATGLTTASYDD